MKRLMSLALCAALIASLFCVPLCANGAANMQAEVRASASDTSLDAIVTLSNDASGSATAVICSTVYQNGALKTVKTQKKELAKGSETLRVSVSYSKAGGEYALIYVWDSALRPLSAAIDSRTAQKGDIDGEKIAFDAESLFATAEPETENGAKNAVDGSLTTKWTASGVGADTPQSITAILAQSRTVAKVGIAFGLGSERVYSYSVEISANGTDYETLVPQQNAQKTNALQYTSVTPTVGKYIRYTLYGRDNLDSAWIQVTEIEAYGFEAQGEYTTIDTFALDGVDLEDEGWTVRAMEEEKFKDYEPVLGRDLYAEAEDEGLHIYDNSERYTGPIYGDVTISSVAASATPEAQNAAQNTIDGDLSTKWTASDVSESTPQSVVATLSETAQLAKVGVAFGLGTSRGYVFSVALSSDGVNYNTVLEKVKSASTNDITYYTFKPRVCRYVKFIFYGRTDVTSGWIQVTELCAKAITGNNGSDGAGGMIVSKEYNIPENKDDYRISFNLRAPDNTVNSAAYFGITLGTGDIYGGADLNNLAALQLRFSRTTGGFSVADLISNQFDEGSLSGSFDKKFAAGKTWAVTMDVSPRAGRAEVTIDDGTSIETRPVYFSYSDEELTRNTTWTGYDINRIYFSSGTKSRAEIFVTDLTVSKKNIGTASDSINAKKGIVRLEAVRVDSDPTTNGSYYGRYIYHSGKADSSLLVAADKDPRLTRFVERAGLIDPSGVSLEALTMPGYFVTNTPSGIKLSKYENSVDYKLRATFIKKEVDSVGYYNGKTMSYYAYGDADKCLCDNTTDKVSGTIVLSSTASEQRSQFYIKSEASAYVSDNFKGDKLKSQWHNGIVWGKANETNRSSASALVDYRNIVMEDGVLFLKATKIAANEWPTDLNGETGKNYNGSYGKNWVKFKGRAAVVSIANKVYNKQCLLEGSFKQPESPIGFWNSFWLTGRDSWPPEIDIFEFLSSTYGHKAFHTAVHGEGNKVSLFGKQTVSTDLTDGFHTFTLDWGYDYIKLYLDGKLYQRAQNNATLAFQKNVRLLLCCGLGGWEAEPDDTMIWDDGMRVDWIRSFQYY